MNQNGFDEIILCGYNGLKIYSYPDEINPVAVIDWEEIYGFFNFADFDHDGDTDICRSSFDNDANILYFSIFENLGNFSFIEHESSLVGGNLVYMTDWDRILAKDINGDGLTDLAYFQGVFYNNGNYEFQEVNLLPINCGPIGYWGFYDFVDINGDSMLDFLTSYSSLSAESFLEIWYQDSNGNFLEEPPVGISNHELIAITYDLNNYPNPCNPSTTINFSIEPNEPYELSIYNIKGQKIRTFSKHQITNSTNHQIVWNGTNSNGRECSSGTYFYKIISDGKELASRKMLLLK
ncbi:MAG TPA: T9SS type A sorting domain-containing protein [Candidatus Cloacimonadota bacterium]|nr:T9SS type A sorting domain-containing protein [Candidatus Cloacimonadota bacterium]